MRLQKILIAAIIAGSFTACKKDTDPVLIRPTSPGADVILSGIAGTEAGSVAGNSVFLDLSGAKQTPVLRAGWDLGFYCGADFRVTLNNFAVAGAKVLAANSLADVTAADTVGLTLTTSQFNPLPSDLAYFDDIAGDITKTVIPAVSATDADNKVIILNRGTGGSIAARAWVKLRVLRNVAGGYTLQYAGIKETTFKIIQVPKDPAFHFKFISFENGLTNVQPEKENWDLVWSYGLFQSNFGAGISPYNFSDLISINHLSGVTVATRIYANATIASSAFNAFNKDSIVNTVSSSNKWAIGSGWRSTQPATGARTDRFYVIKDAEGNYYKFRCVAMGVGTDGGVRGTPKFNYALIK